MALIDVPVGTPFVFEGVSLMTEPCGPANMCGNCYFNNRKAKSCSGRGKIKCTAAQRKDHVSVRFVKL
jgi:hypothetical protein